MVGMKNSTIKSLRGTLKAMIKKDNKFKNWPIGVEETEAGTTIFIPSVKGLLDGIDEAKRRDSIDDKVVFMGHDEKAELIGMDTGKEPSYTITIGGLGGGKVLLAENSDAEPVFHSRVELSNDSHGTEEIEV